MGKKSPIYTVSQLISKLQELQEVHGDIDIRRMDYYKEEQRIIKKVKLVNAHENNSFHGPNYIILID